MQTEYWDSSKFSLENAPYNYAPDLLLQPVHMTLNLDFDIKQKTVQGTNTITLRSNHPDATEISLDAVDFEKLNVLTSNLSYDYDGETLAITLEEALPRGEEMDLEIEYTVIEPTAGLYFSYPDDAYPDRVEYVASDHESERARHWIPSIDHPSVRTTFDYILTADEQYTILAIGKKLDEQIENGRKTVHWKHDFPCPTYISAIAIGDFTEFKDRSVDVGKGEIPVAYYTSSNYSETSLKLGFDRTPEMLEWFYDKFKLDIAWDKYYQFSLPRIFGAMENQSLVSWAEYAVLNEESARELAQRVDDTNVHEMAHTYFGDMVVIKDWGHAWLKESWATYVTSLWYEDKVSAADFAYDMFLNARAYFSEVDGQYTRPIVNRKFHSSWEMFDRHLYPGGAWRLHMLRMELGDSIFFDAVRDYLQTYAGKTVETIDFMRKLEEHSGRSLDGFFDQWVLQARGYPSLKLAFSYSKDKQQGQFTITQSQVSTKSADPKNIPFKFDLDLAWYTGDVYQTKTVRIDQKHHQFTIQVDEKPDHVFLDPDLKVLFKLESSLDDESYHSMLTSPSVFARIHAATKLAESGKRKNLSKLGEAYFNEEISGVRNEFARALGSANSRFAIPYLVKMLETEDDPLMVRSLPVYAANYRDEQITTALITYVNRDLPPFAKNAGIEALGKMRSDEAIEVVKSYLDSTNWKYLNREGAFNALVHTRSEEYVDLFINAIQYGNQPEIIRRSIIFGLGRLGKYQRYAIRIKIKDALVQLLREEYNEVRRTVVSALIQLGEKSVISNIRKIYGLHPRQEVIGMKKSIRSLKKRQRESTKFKDLTDRLEKAEEKIQKLDEKLQKQDDSS